jgi:hypothetical protein
MAKENKLLEWLGRSSPLLESQVVGSGMSKALNALLLHGYADMEAHPTVKEGRAPAAAVRITDKGRALLLTNGES